MENQTLGQRIRLARQHAYMPAMGIPMPGGIATIAMLKRDDPAWNRYRTYIASDVEKYLGPTLRKK